MKKSLFLLPLVALALVGCGDNGGGDDSHTCADNNKDHKCDTCGKVLSQHNDGNGDHNCDVCGVKLSDHSYSFDANGKHKCSCGDTQACVDGNGDNKCDVCGHEMSVAPTDLKLTLEYDNLFEAAGSKSTGYAAIAAITNLGGYTVSFENVCINNLNSKSTPAWTTPSDEQVKVVQFKNAKNGAGVVKFPNAKCSKVSIYLLSSYDVDNDFSVTHGSSVIPMSADAGTATDYASGTGATTYPIKKYVLTFNVNASSAAELKINNNGTGARYLEKIVIE